MTNIKAQWHGIMKMICPAGSSYSKTCLSKEVVDFAGRSGDRYVPSSIY